MKLISLFLILGCITLSAGTFAQNQRVQLDLKNCNVAEFFKTLQDKTNIYFIYNVKNFESIGRLNVKAEDEEVGQLLQRLFGEIAEFEYMDNTVVVKPRIGNALQDTREIFITGVVRDEAGQPIPGVTVLIKGLALGTSTNIKGEFRIGIPEQKGNIVLVFSFIGYENQEIKVTNDKPLQVVMKEDVKEVDEVVVTGYANLRKTSFTGSATHVTKEEILKISSGNLIDALQVFDPSLRVMRNDQMGSDPNTLPEFYLRGRSGFPNVKELDQIESGTDISRFALTNNPNIPIFIMDGFEVSVEKIYDFDINRLKDITILKDAAATAIYGSRASNGVIVIETIPPSPGEFRLSYNGNFGITAPDLSSYNMMNAREALEAEVAAGYFEVRDDELSSGSTYEWYKMLHEWDYQQKYNRILKGVDNYWMAQPLRTEFNQNHSVYIESGTESIRFGIDLNYNNQNGVMKKSYRDRLGAGLTLDYRYKRLMIKNSITYSETHTKASPYGSFSDYSKRHPYDEWLNADGDYVATLPLWGLTGTIEKNPMYEATLGNYDKSFYKEWVNNLSLNWYVNDFLYIKGQLAITDKRKETDKFTDPKSSKWNVNSDSFIKGEKDISSTNTTGWNLNLFASYNRMIASHYFSVSLGLNSKEDRSRYEGTTYQGFPDAQRNQIAFANKVVAKPSSTDNKTRLVGFFGTLNYSFKDIYLFDASFRTDGSSEFGAKKRWAPFWSAGAGINLHKYEFTRDWTFVDQIKIRGTYGQTGRLNVSPYAARHIFNLLLDQWYPGGIGGSLQGLGNENLTWEKQRTVDVGAEVLLFKQLFYFRFNWYNKQTHDMISSIPLPASSGFSSYSDNVGEVRNRGMEFDVRVRLYRDKNWHVMLNGNMASNKNKLMKISQSLKDYNDRVNGYYNQYRTDEYTALLSILGLVDANKKYSRPITKYEEGNSMTTIYGMKSLGINPADGEEVFVKRDGTITYTWSSAETQKIGDTEPKMQGSFGLNAQYRNFSIYTTFLYELGGDKYNQTLVDNVENVNLWRYNADRRVMDDRWQKPGDVTQLKSLKNRYAVTRPTSRFVQKNNTLIFNSLSVGYDFSKEFLSKLNLSTVRLQFNMKDIATISSIKQEMGLDYPFARTFTFSINASF